MQTQNKISVNREYRKLGNLKVSSLGIGGLHFGNLCNQEMTTRIIHRALDAGVNFIDTGPLYGEGNSERLIGQAVRGRRNDVLIATKVGLEANFAKDGSFGVSVVPLNQKNIRASLEKSLKALNTDYIDLYQVHAFDRSTSIEETMEALNTIVREGKIRFIGCSNYLRGELEIATEAATRNKWVPFVSFQAHYNMLERRAEEEIIRSCQTLGVALICNRPLSRGILTGKYKPDQPLPEGSRAVTSNRIRRWLSQETLRLVEALVEFARKYDRTVSELSIAWLLAQPDVSLVLAGARNTDQLDMNIRATGWSLNDTELAEIDEIIRRMNMMPQVKAMPETLFET